MNECYATYLPMNEFEGWWAEDASLNVLCRQVFLAKRHLNFLRKMARFKTVHPTLDEEFKLNEGENSINQPQVRIVLSKMIVWYPWQRKWFMSLLVCHLVCTPCLHSLADQCNIKNFPDSSSTIAERTIKISPGYYSSSSTSCRSCPGNPANSREYPLSLENLSSQSAPTHCSSRIQWRFSIHQKETPGCGKPFWHSLMGRLGCCICWCTWWS